MTSTADGTTEPGDTPTPNAPRASDADRHATVHLLQDAVARGLLTPAGGSDRMGAAYAARHVCELPPLTADLPSAPAPETGPTPTPGWRSLAGLTWVQARASVDAISSDGLRSRRGLVAVAAVLLTLTMLVVLGVAGLHLLFGDGHDLGDISRHH